MRRRYRGKKKPLSITAIMVIFIVTICSMSIGYSLLSEELSISGKGNLVVPEPADGKYSITYTKNKWYNNGRYYYDFTVTIKNLTSSIVNGWTLVMYVPQDSADLSCWNAQCTQGTKKITFTPMLYNRLILPRLTARFGFQISTTNANLELYTGLINGLRFNNTPVGEDPTDPNPPVVQNPVKVTLTNSSEWQDSGYFIKQLTFNIANETDKSTSSWKFDLGVPAGTSVYGSWSMGYIQKDNVITFSNESWNNRIAANDTLEVSVQLKSTSNNYTPTITNIITEYEN